MINGALSEASPRIKVAAAKPPLGALPNALHAWSPAPRYSDTLLD